MLVVLSIPTSGQTDNITIDNNKKKKKNEAKKAKNGSGVSAGGGKCTLDLVYV